MRIGEQALIERPFCTLRRYRLGRRDAGPRVLVVSPASGHRATLLLGETVRDLLASHDVHLTDWADAGDVPVQAGRFGWDEMIGYLVEFLQALGPRTHVVGMSQSGLPVLTAAAILAATEDAAVPCSLTIMGGLLDSSISPTRMNRLARAAFGEAAACAPAATWLLRRVPQERAGRGRLVYPAATQRAALLAYLWRRIGVDRPTALAAFQKGLIGDGTPPRASRAYYEAFLDVMDLPAEIYLDTMAVLFGREPGEAPLIRWQGRTFQPSAIARTALMTVEAEHDDISGHGQTHCAHDMFPGLPGGLRLHVDVASAGHLGMFHGRVWRGNVLPRLAGFIRDADAGIPGP